jgi:hypothetical protein
MSYSRCGGCRARSSRGGKGVSRSLTVSKSCPRVLDELRKTRRVGVQERTIVIASRTCNLSLAGRGGQPRTSSTNGAFRHFLLLFEQDRFSFPEGLVRAYSSTFPAAPWWQPAW